MPTFFVNKDRVDIAASVPADTPLPQTPARNLPPLDRRGQPMHYCPQV